MRKTANIQEKILAVIQRGAPLTDTRFNALALELFEWQLARNAPNRRYCCGKKVRHWREIPSVPTTAFKEASLTTISPRKRVVEFRSSGTTLHLAQGRLHQNQSRHFHSEETLVVYEASVREGFKHFLITGRDACATLYFLTASPKETPHSSLVWMMETIRREWGGEFFVRDGRVDCARLLRRLTSPFPSYSSSFYLLGTALAFAQFFDYLERKRLRLKLPAGSWAMETGGFKGQRREISQAVFFEQFENYLGLNEKRIISEYGMCELSSQFYTSRISLLTPRSFFGPPWARALVIDPETGREAREGKRGLIRVIDLANVGSVLAVQTEDVGVRRGDEFELLGRAPMAEVRGCSLMIR